VGFLERDFERDHLAEKSNRTKMGQKIHCGLVQKSDPNPQCNAMLDIPFTNEKRTYVLSDSQKLIRGIVS
jgi:hypothetical protein